MRKLLVLFAMGMMAFPLFAAQRVSVEQLRRALAELHGQSDKKVAKQIAGLELTERLNRTEFEGLIKTLPGPKSRAVLLGIADASAFLDPPESERIGEPAPDEAAQRQMLMKAAQLASDQADRIPTFLAMRNTEHFQDVRVYPFSNKIEYYTPGSFRLVEEQTDDISCSDGGDEVLDQPDKDLDKRMSRQPQPLMYMDAGGYHTIWGDVPFYLPNPTPEGLKPTGVFGPWLKAVTGDIPGAKSEWARWERSARGRLAVFSFHIPREESHYTIKYDFAVDSKDPMFSAGTQFIDSPGYHGEIAIDPNSGRVARIVVICDLATDEPISTAKVEFEYGPVELGESEYVLPLRGVIVTSFSLATRHYQYDNWSMDHFLLQTDHFTVTSIDDVSFSSYRIGKPRLRIVPRLIAPLKSLNGPVK